MRCSSASARRAAWAAALALAAVPGPAACRRTVTQAYLPSPSNPRFSPPSASRTLATYLSVECERLRAEQITAGVATVRVAADGAGAVTRAEIARGSGSATLDALIGTVAAQLQLDPPAPGARATGRTVRVEYSCAQGQENATITVP